MRHLLGTFSETGGDGHATHAAPQHWQQQRAEAHSAHQEEVARLYTHMDGVHRSGRRLRDMDSPPPPPPRAVPTPAASPMPTTTIVGRSDSMSAAAAADEQHQYRSASPAAARGSTETMLAEKNLELYRMILDRDEELRRVKGLLERAETELEALRLHVDQRVGERVKDAAELSAAELNLAAHAAEQRLKAERRRMHDELLREAGRIEAMRQETEMLLQRASDSASAAPDRTVDDDASTAAAVRRIEAFAPPAPLTRKSSRHRVMLSPLPLPAGIRWKDLGVLAGFIVCVVLFTVVVLALIVKAAQEDITTADATAVPGGEL
jgi:tetrahydromethanopterin S-methyltransferase subunit G